MFKETTIFTALALASFLVLTIKGLKVVNAQAVPSIAVTSPTSGASLNNSANAITNINWTSSNTNSSPIEIDLLNTSGQIVKYIATGIPNTGSYTWQYDPMLTSGTYKIAVSTQVKTGTSGDAYGTSGYFTITTSPIPAITVTYPTNGASLNNSENAITNINWTSSNVASAPIEIDLLNTSGAIVKNIASDVSNTGSYTWQYDPTLTSGTYKIAVSTQVKVGTPGDAYGTSGYFTITTNIPVMQPIPFYSSMTPVTVAPTASNNVSNPSQQALQQELVQLITLLLQLLQKAAAQGLLSPSQLSAALGTLSY